MAGSPEPALALLHDLWQRRAWLWRPRWRATGLGDRWEDLEAKLAREIGKAVVAPLRALGLDPRSLPDGFLAEHVLAMTLVLRHAIDQEDYEEPWPLSEEHEDDTQTT
jgi:hypothetical protein